MATDAARKEKDRAEERKPTDSIKHITPREQYGPAFLYIQWQAVILVSL